MEIKKQYLQKYLHSIAIDQIAEDYRQKGYTISKEEQVGKFRADLIARKENETIVIEIKSGRMTPEKKETIIGLGNYVRSQGNYKFLVVIATPPKEKKLEITEIKNLLSEYLDNNIPGEIDALSTHPGIDEVTDIDIDEITVNGKSLFVKGYGVLNVELQYGSDGDQGRGDGYKTFDNFPFEYELTLEYDEQHKLKIKKVDKLEVDTTSFSE
jgi:hypothetical protein